MGLSGQLKLLVRSERNGDCRGRARRMSATVGSRKMASILSSCFPIVETVGQERGQERNAARIKFKILVDFPGNLAKWLCMESGRILFPLLDELQDDKVNEAP